MCSPSTRMWRSTRCHPRGRTTRVAVAGSSRYCLPPASRAIVRRTASLRLRCPSMMFAQVGEQESSRSAMKTFAPELSALIIILRSTGPVISTRRSVRSTGAGATCHPASRSMPPRAGKWSGVPTGCAASAARCGTRSARRVRRRSSNARCRPARKARASSVRMSSVATSGRASITTPVAAEDSGMSWQEVRGSDVSRFATYISALSRRTCFTHGRSSDGLRSSGTLPDAYRRMEMMLHRVTRYSLAVALLGLPAAAGAQAFGLNEIGSCAVARGFATTSAPCDDASSIYWNPGAMQTKRGFSLYGGAAVIKLNGDFTQDTTHRVYEADAPTAVVPHLFLNYRGAGKFAYGLGVYVPYGLTSQWTDSFPGRFAAKKASLQTIYFQPNLAYQINDKWSVGGGPIIAHSTVELIQAIDLSSQVATVVAGNPITFGQLGIA